MNPILKNILAVVVGVIVGGIVNGVLISLNEPVFGVAVEAEGLKEAISTFTFKHYIFPFLGHAVGTLVGGFLAAKIAATHKMKLALVIGVFFLAGGIVMADILGYPMPFTAIDLLLAYIPMGWLGGKLANRS